jgi:hypothetical protein
VAAQAMTASGARMCQRSGESAYRAALVPTRRRNSRGVMRCSYVLSIPTKVNAFIGALTIRLYKKGRATRLHPAGKVHYSILDGKVLWRPPTLDGRWTDDQDEAS